jgi:hypothetical protein
MPWKIRLESEPGRGTRAIVSLPLAMDTPQGRHGLDSMNSPGKRIARLKCLLSLPLPYWK